MSSIIISCDGGARIKPGVERAHVIGGFGVVMIFGEHRKEIKEGHLGVTNNQMEILAVTRGLESIVKPTVPVEVQSDSAYVINALTKGWLDKWSSNGWLKSDKQPVENIDLWKGLLDQVDRFKFITFTKVKGHSDNDLNNRADALANEAMDELTSKLKSESDSSKSVAGNIDRETYRELLFNQAKKLSNHSSSLASFFQNSQGLYSKKDVDEFTRAYDSAIEDFEKYKTAALKLLTGGN